MTAQVDHIVVYGTLMTGQRAHALMGTCEFEGTVQLRGVMYDLLGFPGVQLNGVKPIKAELYKLPSVAGKSNLIRTLVLQRLDQFEGTALYTRRTINVTHGKRSLPAFIYELNGTHGDEDVIPSGCWLTHLRNSHHE